MRNPFFANIRLSPFWNLEKLAKRKNLKAKANQQETSFKPMNSMSDHTKLGSSETTREASFHFSDFYKLLPKHKTEKGCTPTFLTWFIGFVEADGYYSSRFYLNNLKNPQSFSKDNGKLCFEITQKEPQILYKIRNNLGFGVVFPIKKEKNAVFYRFYTSKKEHIVRLLHLLNGNLVLKQRRQQYETWFKQANLFWNLNLTLKPWTAQPSTANAWLCGFVEGDGGFYTNQGNNFVRGKYPDGRIRYGFSIKFYITQYGEDEVLLQIRDLFQATNKLNSFQNKSSLNLYTRLEISNVQSRILILDYFQNFPLLTTKKVDFLRWQRVHGYQQRGVRLSEKSAKKLKVLLDKLHLDYPDI
jgi:hypothetical protein